MNNHSFFRSKLLPLVILSVLFACVTLGSVPFTFADTYSLTSRVQCEEAGKNGLPSGKRMADLATTDVLNVTASNAQMYFSGSSSNTYTVSCQINIQGDGYGSEKTGKFRMQVGGKTVNLNGTVNLTGNTVISNHDVSGTGGTLYFNNQITGVGGLIVAPNTNTPVRLNNTTSNLNNYAGNTQIGGTGLYPWSGNTTRGGYLILDADEQIPDAKTAGASSTGNVVMMISSKLDLNGHTETINGLSSTDTNSVVTGYSGSKLIVGANNATATFAGKIQEGIVLEKIGTGTQTLSGTNSYYGNTIITEGTLQLTGAFNDSSSIEIGDNGTLELAQSSDLELSPSISGTGAIVKSGTGTLIVYGTSSSNTFTVDNGTLQIGYRVDSKVNVTSKGKVTIGADNETQEVYTAKGFALDGGTINFDFSDYSGSYSYYDKLIANDGTIDLNSGTLNLNFMNGDEYSWYTDENAYETGYLLFSGTSGTTDFSGVTLAGTSMNWCLANGDNGIYLRASGVLSTYDVSDTSLDLSGDWTLDGTEHMLVVFTEPRNGSYSETHSGKLAITAEGTIEVGSGFELNQSGEISGTATMIKKGDGTLILSKKNTFEGTVSVDAGELKLTAQDAIANAKSVNNASTISMTADQTINNPTGSGTYNIDGNQLTFKFDTDTSFEGTISGSGSFKKTGTGKMTPTVNAGYTGGTTISEGTMYLSDINKIGTGGITLEENGTLDWAFNSNLNQKVTGSGTLYFSGSKSYITNGTFDLENQLDNFTGTIELGGKTRLLWNKKGSTALDNATIVVNGDGGSNNAEFWPVDVTVGCDIVLSGNGAGAGGDGTARGAIRVEGTTVFNGNISLKANSLISGYSASNATFNGTIDVNGKTLTFSRTNADVTYNILGDVKSSVAGSGTVEYANNGNIYMNIGNTAASEETAVQTISVNIANNNTSKTLNFRPGDNRTVLVTGAISGGGSLTMNGTGTTTLQGATTFTGATSVNSGTLKVMGSTYSSSSIALKEGTTIEFGTDSTLSYSNAITGSGTILKSGTGTFKYDASKSTTTGLLSIANGNLQLNGTYAGSVSIAEAASMSIGFDNATTSSTIGSSLTLDGGTINYDFSAFTSYAHDLLSVNGDIALTAGTINLNFAANEELWYNNSGKTGYQILSGDYSASNALADITVTGGSKTWKVEGRTDGLYLVSEGATITSYDVSDSVNVNLAEAWTVDGVEHSGVLFTQDRGTSQAENHTGTLEASDFTTVNVGDGYEFTQSGAISGSANIMKLGDGTFVVAGNASGYTGQTLIHEGTLKVSEDGTLGSGAIVNNSTLEIADMNSDLTLSQVISGSGKLVKTGNDTLTIQSANNSYSGGTEINEGTVILNTGGNGTSPLGSGTIYIGPNGKLISQSANQFKNYSNMVIEGTFVPFIYTNIGAITLNNGTITEITGTGSNPQGLNLGSGRNITATGESSIASYVSIPRGINDSLQISVPSADDTLTISGIIQTDPHTSGATGSINKTGSGTLILTGANTYTGTTTISGGKILVTGNGKLGTNTITNNSILEMADLNSARTISQGMNGSGTFIVRGEGTTVSLTNTGSGAYKANTIQVADGATLNILMTNAGIYNFEINGGTMDFTSSGNNYCDGNIAPNIKVTQSSVNSHMKGSVNLHNGRTWTVDVVDNSTLDISATLWNGGGVTKTGKGTLILSGANSYTGNTTLSQGVLQLQNNLTSFVSMVSGTKLELGSDSATQAITLSKGLTLNGGTVNFDFASYDGSSFDSLNVSGGSLTLTNGLLNMSFTDATDEANWHSTAGTEYKLLSYSSSSAIDTTNLSLTGTTLNWKLEGRTDGLYLVSSDVAGPSLYKLAKDVSESLTIDGSVYTGVQFDSSTSTTKNATISETLQLNSNGSFVVGEEHTYTQDGLSGSGSLYKYGTGTLVVTGDASGYTGAINIGEGMLEFTNLDSEYSTSKAITGNGGLAVSGEGTVVNLTNGDGKNYYYYGPTVISDGATLKTSWQRGATEGFIINNGTLDSSGSKNFFMDDNIIPYIKVTEKNATSYFKGSLNLHNYRIWSLDVAEGSTLNISANLSNGGGFTKIGQGTVVFSGSNSFTGGLAINEGQVTVMSGCNPGYGKVTVSEGTTLLFDYTTPKNVTFDSKTAFCGNGTITFKSTGTTDAHFGLNNMTGSTFSGTYNVDGARLSVTSQGALGSKDVTVNVYNNGQFYMGDGAGDITANLFIEGNGAREGTGTNQLGALRIQSGTLSGTITLTGDALITNHSANGERTIYSDINVGEHKLTVNLMTNKDIVLAGDITGSGPIEKLGGYTLKLRGNNSEYSGTFTTSQSNTYFYSADAGSAKATWNVIGTLGSELSTDSTIQLGAITGTGLIRNDVDDTTVTFEIGGANTDCQFDGKIQDYRTACKTAISKVGTGTLKLTNDANAYSAGTKISGGAIELTDTGMVGTGAVDMTASGTLLFTVDTEKTFSNTITGTGTLVKTGNGVLKLFGTDENPVSAGVFNVNAGELAFKGTYNGNLVVNESGIFSPGNSVGDLNITVGDFTLNANGTALFEFDSFVTGSEFDHLILNNGKISIDNSGKFEANFSSVDEQAWYEAAGEDGYKLIAGNYSGTYNLTDLLNTDDLINDWYLLGKSDGIYLSATLPPEPTPGSGVPEPSTWALLILGFASLMWKLRSERQEARSENA